MLTNQLHQILCISSSSIFPCCETLKHKKFSQCVGIMGQTVKELKHLKISVQAFEEKSAPHEKQNLNYSERSSDVMGKPEIMEINKRLIWGSFSIFTRQMFHQSSKALVLTNEGYIFDTNLNEMTKVYLILTDQVFLITKRDGSLKMTVIEVIFLRSIIEVGLHDMKVEIILKGKHGDQALKIDHKNYIDNTTISATIFAFKTPSALHKWNSQVRRLAERFKTENVWRILFKKKMVLWMFVCAKGLFNLSEFLIFCF